VSDDLSNAPFEYNSEDKFIVEENTKVVGGTVLRLLLKCLAVEIDPR
jgi:hypothetical protein